MHVDYVILITSSEDSGGHVEHTLSLNGIFSRRLATLRPETAGENSVSPDEKRITSRSQCRIGRSRSQKHLGSP